MNKARDPRSSGAAYLLAIGWLAARELSEGQVRERLDRCGFTREAINPAVQRLISEGMLDNRRAATAVARTEAQVRRHGPRRILGKLTGMRFDRDLAKEVVQELFGETDETELLEQTLDKRLHGNTARLREPHERRKLIAYLVRQGFTAAAASGLIRKRSREK